MEQGGFSKGVVYHYFKNKDALYLYCLKETFDSLASFLEAHDKDYSSVEEALMHYYEMRTQFFSEHQDLQTIFTNAMFNPPVHLFLDLQEAKSNLNDYNISFFSKILKNVKLKRDYELHDIIETFSVASYGIAKKLSMDNKLTHEDKLQIQEEKMKSMIHIILYGITKK